MQDQTHILSLVKKLIKILNLKLVMLEYQNIKMFQKFTFQIGLKKFLWLKKLKTLCRRTDLNREEIVQTF